MPRLVTYLAGALKLSRSEVVALLRERAPRLASALLALPDTTTRWNALPATAGMTRLDGVTPVGTMAELDDYLRQDLAPIFVTQRRDFERLAGSWPPLDALAPLVLVVGLVVLLYGALLMQFVGRRY